MEVLGVLQVRLEEGLAAILTVTALRASQKEEPEMDLVYHVPEGRRPGPMSDFPILVSTIKWQGCLGRALQMQHVGYMIK